MASVYIMFSEKLNKFYIGSCLNLAERMADHKNKIYMDSFTTLANDWDLYFTIDEIEGSVARTIEQHIKSMKSKRYIENLRKYPEIIEKLISKYTV